MSKTIVVVGFGPGISTAVAENLANSRERGRVTAHDWLVGLTAVSIETSH